MQIVGSPAQVVERFLQLKQAGCDGVQLTFFDFAADLEFFGQEVLPLMTRAFQALDLQLANTLPQTGCRPAVD